MPRVYIGVGSNIEPEINIPKALRILAEVTPIMAISTFYRTPPMGSPDSPEFYNGVVAVDSRLDLRDLQFGVLRQIESALGRVRSADPNAPRTIDLDIEVCEDEIIKKGSDLVIPDPNIVKRPFLALPLLELDPEIMLPELGKLAELARNMDCESMTPLEDFTKQLRQEMKLEP
jgi:2-amino-4-hydroxy-6-hydroxymethyldihydropteridine diphosphokinase